MHEELTEIYQIIEGSGTLLTAGVSQKVKPKDVIDRFEAPQGKKE